MDNTQTQTHDNTVVFDFDGVIHPYTSGWQGATSIYDPPVQGIKELFAKLKSAGLYIVVMSSRAIEDEGKKAIIKYLNNNGMQDLVDDVVSEKIPELVYVDDRTICFTGKTEGLFEQIVDFRSWVDNV